MCDIICSEVATPLVLLVVGGDRFTLKKVAEATFPAATHFGEFPLPVAVTTDRLQNGQAVATAEITQQHPSDRGR